MRRVKLNFNYWLLDDVLNIQGYYFSIDMVIGKFLSVFDQSNGLKDVFLILADYLEVEVLL